MRKLSEEVVLALVVSFVFIAVLLPVHAASQASGADIIVIDAQAHTHPFPHFWEHMFGSERASVTLRESYRNDLRSTKQITAVQYVRFHAIFLDDMGVYDEDEQGRPICNFSYVDQVYDGLLANGVRPFVELSFMPNKLASQEILHSFWYKQNTSPPKNMDKWVHLITLFTQHLVERYGVEEVAKWYFEVWNEPNIDFWMGNPKQATYFELYDHTVIAIKGVSPRLRVGGPSTAQAGWADDFIRHCAEKKIPVDFVSSHVYGNDRSEDVFGNHEDIPRGKMVCRAVKKVHDQIKASALPDLPLFWSEFNASYMNEPPVTDTVYMGPWLADTIRQCDGLVDEMSYWTFSDVFEEQGVVKQPFYGGFGLIAAGGIPKPSFNAFKLLHRLGDQRLALDSDTALATRKKNGSLAVAVWNYAPPEQAGTPKTVTLRFKGMKSGSCKLSRLDRDHGDIHPAYETMGSPRYPTQAQLRELKKASELPASETCSLKGEDLTLTLPSYGLALLEVK
jgi:xylan 1,4-beta-xylosidase